MNNPRNRPQPAQLGPKAPSRRAGPLARLPIGAGARSGTGRRADGQAHAPSRYGRPLASCRCDHERRRRRRRAEQTNKQTSPAKGARARAIGRRRFSGRNGRRRRGCGPGARKSPLREQHPDAHRAPSSSPSSSTLTAAGAVCRASARSARLWALAGSLGSEWGTQQ